MTSYILRVYRYESICKYIPTIYGKYMYTYGLLTRSMKNNESRSQRSQEVLMEKEKRQSVGFSKGFYKHMANVFGDVDNLISMKDLRNIIYKECGYGLAEQERYSDRTFKCHHLAVGESILWPRRYASGASTRFINIMVDREQEAREHGLDRKYDFVFHDAEYCKVTRFK